MKAKRNIRPIFKRTEVLSEDTILGEYFGYLCSLVGSPDLVERRENLLQTLFKAKFESTVPNDDNRIDDGKKLREEFGDLTGLGVGPYSPPTVLEVLIGVARRLDFILYDFSDGDRSQILFWKLLKNLELILEEQNEDDTRQNEEIIVTFVERKYDFYGRGGLFPLYRRPKEDQRKVELWYQMANWVNENYECC